jgi:predicted transcriptional regulator
MSARQLTPGQLVAAIQANDQERRRLRAVRDQLVLELYSKPGQTVQSVADLLGRSRAHVGKMIQAARTKE